MLVAGLIVSCEEDDMVKPVENATGTGLTEITFSSFKATPGPDAEGLEDGTYITVKPLAIGVSSYVVDFGIAGGIKTIQPGGSASYDYPNEAAEATYTITVTAKSDKGFNDVTLTEDIKVSHSVTAVTSVPASPSLNDADLYSLFSNGMVFNGEFLSWEHSEATSGGNSVSVDGNDVLQFSRLSSNAGVLALKNAVVPSGAFGSGIAATHIHFDVHSSFDIGINTLKITLVNNGASETYEVDGLSLTDGEWTSFDFDLANDFSAAVGQIDEIKFELGTGGTAKDAATINVDNVYLYKAPSSEILNGNFDLKTAQWRFATFTDGTTTPFGSSSDGSWKNYDGSDNGKKTKGAKWTASQSGGPLQASGSRYAYQALTLTPNTDYVFEYEYAIKSDTANDPIGGRRMIGVVLDGHFIDGADAVDALSSNLGNHVGTIAEGKFSDTRGTLVKVPFTTNDSGEVAILFYAVTSKDAWVDNVKVYLD